ncbi:6-phospho-3-hexuloisomerase [Candidatus Bathyarchaeota archaeon]|nr:6-phospho-3-hexuloisomerase [Candidatus Bathyarchaeota archaeon]
MKRVDWFRRASEEILEYTKLSVHSMDTVEVEVMIAMITNLSERKILIVGAGRSGLVARSFAMRLMHLGFRVFVVGETITPAIDEGDILLAISGSGETSFVVSAARMTKQRGANVIAITSFPKSTLGKIADHIVVLYGRTKLVGKSDYLSRQIVGDHDPLPPLGTLFEISCMIFLDSVVVELMHRLGKDESAMRKRHATIE